MAPPLYHQLSEHDTIDAVVLTYSPLSLPLDSGRNVLASVNPGLLAARAGDYVRIPDPWRDRLGLLYDEPQGIVTTTETDCPPCDPPSRLLWAGVGFLGGAAVTYTVGAVLFFILEDKITDDLIAARRARSR